MRSEIAPSPLLVRIAYPTGREGRELSERRWALEAQALARLRMGEGEHAGVQAQALMGGQGLFVGVEAVA